MFFLRFLGGAFFLALASLTLVEPPNRFLWGASVAATEAGYWLALAATLVVIPTRDRWRLGRMGTLMAMGAIALFVMPVVRARTLNETLPTALDKSFGSTKRVRHAYAEPPRAEPLVLTELLNPAGAPAVRYEERVFASHGGHDLSLSIYRPSYVHDEVPAVLVVHGGSWADGNRRELATFNAWLASRDYVVAALDYRLAPAWPFPAARDDVLSALAFLKVYAGELRIDGSRIALLGRSGGAQLALLAAYTVPDPSIRGVISLHGASDLRFAHAHPSAPKVKDTRAAIEAYLGGAPGSAKDALYDIASPVNFVGSASPPTLLVHGDRDPIVSARQTANLESRLQQAGVKHHFVRLPWATHGCEVSYGGPCGQIVSYAVERFLDTIMARPPAKAEPDRKASAEHRPRPAAH